MTSTSPAPTSRYSASAPLALAETGGQALSVGNSQGPARRLTQKERKGLLQRGWERLVFEPVGLEPSDFEARERWHIEGQTRGALNFLGIAKTTEEHPKEGEASVQPFPLCPACAKEDVANDDWRLIGNPPYQVCVCRAHGKRHKPYFRVLTQAWQSSEITNFEKLSRQILGSWWAVGVHLWLAMTAPGALIGFQSSNLTKARELLIRAETIYKTLPLELQRYGPMSDAPKAGARKIEDEISFKQRDQPKSRIITLPCGPKAARMFTFTAIFIDECQHWDVDEEFEDSYGAALACAKGGGRLTTVSSVGAPGSYHHRLCNELIA